MPRGRQRKQERKVALQEDVVALRRQVAGFEGDRHARLNARAEQQEEINVLSYQVRVLERDAIAAREREHRQDQRLGAAKQTNKELKRELVESQHTVQKQQVKLSDSADKLVVIQGLLDTTIRALHDTALDSNGWATACRTVGPLEERVAELQALLSQRPIPTDVATNWSPMTWRAATSVSTFDEIASAAPPSPSPSGNS